MGSCAAQYRALCYKNLILKRRRPILATCEVLAPALFTVRQGYTIRDDPRQLPLQHKA